MQLRELDEIEQALGLKLPELYRSEMAACDARELVLNVDTGAWDDARALIALNEQLRAGVIRWPGGWPAHWFAVSKSEDPHDAAQGFQTIYVIAIDVRGTDAPVWSSVISDHRTPSSGLLEQRFDHYLARVLAYERKRQGARGFERGKPEGAVKPLTKAGCLGILLVLAALVAIAVVAVRFGASRVG